ncbi:hypothetical protein ABPG72_013322 [Tetrahymena utriculariae]
MNLQLQYQNFNNPPHSSSSINPQQFSYGNSTNVSQNPGFIGQNGMIESPPSLLNLKMQNMIKTEGMQSQLQNQLAIQQAMHNMNYFANPALYANQARLNSEGNLNALGGVGGIQPSSNHNINSTSFLEGSGASYKQYLKNNKGSNHQLNDSNNSPGSVPHSHHNINISHFKNKRIIVKHANIVKKKRQIKIWTSEEDELLKRLCEQMPGKWNEIAAKISGRNASQCSQRWRRILPTKVRKPWTPEEDQKVLELSEKYGKNWGMIAQHIEGKTGKQVRERYINKLDPSIKRSPWTEEEDQKILDMFLEQGPKWSAISNELVGRPENTVKNRFYSHISRIYLSDDNSYLANRNSDNNQKVKDACSNNTKNNPSKKKQIQVKKVAAKNLNVMEEDDLGAEHDEDDDDDDDDDDEDDDEEEDDERSQNNNHLQNSQNMHNGNGKLGLNAPASMYSHINQAVANASQQFAMQNETNKNRRNQQKNTFGNSLTHSNSINNNDKKNLKIEEQDDQDEELMEGNPQIEEEDEDTNKKTHLSLAQKNNEEGKDTLQNRGNGLNLNRLSFGSNINANNLENQSGDKQPISSNSILARRGIQGQNIKIPKADSINPIQNGGATANPSNISNNNEGENNALAGVQMMSTGNLDFITQTPSNAYNQGGLNFVGGQYMPFYTGFHNNQIQVNSQAQLNQPSSASQHEAASPMFVLGAGINSPAPRNQLPLFKPPISGIGNNTPSAITPLVGSSYLVYTPSQLGMSTPGIFNYNPMITPYYMPNKFTQLQKIGGGTLNELDKLDGDNSTYMNMVSNNYPQFENNGISSMNNFHFAPPTPTPTPGISPNQFFNNNNTNSATHQNKISAGNNFNNSNINQQQQQNQQINTNDLIGFQSNENNSNNTSNKNGSSISISPSVAEQKRDDKNAEASNSNNKASIPTTLESLMKEINSLDPENQKLLGQMLQSKIAHSHPQDQTENNEKMVKEEHTRKSFSTYQ